jgi:hypothetical protein
MTAKEKIIEGSAPLTEEFMKEREKAAREFEALSDTLNTRAAYICECIFKCFNRKFDCCYFDGAEEGEFGDFDNAKCGDYFQIVTEPSLEYPSCILLKDQSNWSIYDGIPVRWLTEDFESELYDGRKAYLEKIEADKKKRAERKAKAKSSKKDKVLAQVKEKLTKEELKALGIK